MPHDLTELASLDTDELRKMLRNEFPATKGIFAVYASQEVCRAILSGAQRVADYQVAQDPADQKTKVTLRTDVAPAPSSSSTSSEPAGNVVTDPSDKAVVEAVAKTVRMLNCVDPGAAAAIENLYQGYKQRGTSIAQLQQEVADGKMVVAAPIVTEQVDGKECVDICGVKVPVRLKPGDPGYEWVPAVDPHFDFEAWNAKCKSASGVIKQKASIAIMLMLAGENIHLYGPPGVGKTELFKQICARAGWPFIRMQGDKHVTSAEFLGEKTVEGGNIKFVDGLLTIAMTIGAVFVADEIDYFPADCRTALNPVLERGGHLVLVNDGGRVVKPHANFRFVATGNTNMFGDDTGLFPDANVQNAALVSRMGAKFHVDWLPPKREVNILRSWSGIDKPVAELMVRVAVDTRKASAQQTMNYPLTTRHLIAWALQSKIIGLDHSFALTCVNAVPPSDQTVLLEIAQRHFGDKLKAMFTGGTDKEDADVATAAS